MKTRKLIAGLVLALPAFAFAQASAPAATPPAAPAADKPAAPAAAAPTAPAAAAGDALAGKAAWYGGKFNGRRTASGQRFDTGAMTAAHRSLAFGTRVKVTNTQNKRSVVLTVNDRMPAHPERVIDVTRAAATKLGFVRAGLADVKLEVVGEPPKRRARKA